MYKKPVKNTHFRSGMTWWRDIVNVWVLCLLINSL